MNYLADFNFYIIVYLSLILRFTFYLKDYILDINKNITKKYRKDFYMTFWLGVSFYLICFYGIQVLEINSFDDKFIEWIPIAGGILLFIIILLLVIPKNFLYLSIFDGKIKKLFNRKICFIIEIIILLLFFIIFWKRINCFTVINGFFSSYLNLYIFIIIFVKSLDLLENYYLEKGFGNPLITGNCKGYHFNNIWEILKKYEFDDNESNSYKIVGKIYLFFAFFNYVFCFTLSYLFSND